MTLPLAGLRLWITRPRGQAQALHLALAQLGAIPHLLPLLEIAPPTDSSPLNRALEQLESFDLAIFISPSALDAVVPLLPRGWPENLPVALMGPGSAQRARELGISQLLIPEQQFDSEGLLQLAQMQHLANKRIVLFRGNGGRESLPQTLLQRGAILSVVPAYQRLPPALDTALLAENLAQGCDGILVSSSEAVDYLFDLAGGQTRQQLQSLLYFASHPRIIAALASKGASRAVLTGAGDAGVTAALTEYFSPASGQTLTAKKTHDAG